MEAALAEGRPFDQIVRELLTATGGTFTEPATNFWQVERDTLALTENVAQAFLGMRIQCAQCHNHPFDRWTMDDYYGFAAFFAQVGRKRTEDPRESIVFDARRGGVRHPVGNRVMEPKFLGGEHPDTQNEDRRAVLAEWLASADNPWFAKNLANRLWAHFFGVGIVEPIDDVRISNPPANAPLLEHLAGRLVETEFDLRALVREICASRTYQLATQRPEGASSDPRNNAHAIVRRMRAEVLLDAISQVTRTPNKFRGLPLGARAVQIADGRTSDYFLETFGRASRRTVCSCEVVMEPSLSQALHLLNGPATLARIQRGGLLAEWIAAGLDDATIVESLYWRCFGRAPDDDERQRVLELLPAAEEQRIAALEDVFWALLNSKEFLFNH